MSALRGHPRPAVLTVVLLVALAFVLGAAGTASAGALTKGAVKKIAAKVVMKQAPSLSVRHAVTADSALKATTATTATNAANADLLGGQTAAELGVRPIVYTLPKGQAYPSSKSWTLSGVPAGSYLVSLHMIVGTLPSGTPITFAECTVNNQTTDDYPIAVNQIAPAARVPALNGSGYATVAAGDHLVLGCDANAGWMPSYDGHVTLTPAASVVTGTLTAP
jgi:hypothetical protein